MKARCQRASHPDYPRYGGRGVKVCQQWQAFDGFKTWALAQGYTDDREIDREQGGGDYCPENCRWVLKIVNLARRWAEGTAPIDGLLSDEVALNAEIRASAYKLVDGHGLYLRVGPTGVKSWRYKYRFAGREKLLTFGRFPELSVADARLLHAAARAKLARGRDPIAIGRANKARADRRRASKVGVATGVSSRLRGISTDRKSTI